MENTQATKKDLLYHKAGQINGIGSAVISLIAVTGLSTMLYIFVGTFSGQVYQTAESSITAITNSTIQGYVESAIATSFQSFSTTAGYQPLIMLALVMAVVFGVLFSVFAGFGRGLSGGGSAL